MEPTEDRDDSEDTVEIVPPPSPPPSEDRGSLGVQFLLPLPLSEQAGAT